MANVTITACANSTPPANTVVATCALTDSSQAQLFMLADQSRNIYGVTGSPMVVSGSAVVTNQVSASISNTVNVLQTNMAGSAGGSPLFVSVTNQVSASLSGGSVALLSGANRIGAASVIQASPAAITSAWPMQLTDTVDTVAVDAASRLLTAASIVNSPSVVVSSGSLVVTNALSASISNTVTVAQGASGASPWGMRVLDAGGNAYGVSAASPLYITGGAAGGTSATDKAAYAEGTTSYTPIGGFYSTNPVTLTACQAGAARLTANRALHVRLSDEGGNVLGVSAASPLYITGGAAGGTSATDQSAYAAGTTSFTPAGGFYSANPVALTACQSGGFLMTPYRGQHVNLRDSAGNELGLTGSPLVTSIAAASVTVINQVSASISNSPSVVVASGSVVVTNTVSASVGNTVNVLQTNMAGSAAGSPLFMFATNLTGSAAGSPTFVSVTNSPSMVVSSGSVVVTNGLSASISNTVNVLQLNMAGSAAGSPLFVLATNLTGSAAGSPTFASITNLAGSAGGSPLFVSVTNQVSASLSGGSVALLAGANIIGVASAIQGTAAAITAPWPVKLSDSQDSVAITAASQLTVSASIANVAVTTASGLHANLRDATGNVLGVSGSPLVVEDDNGSMAVSGSLLAVQVANISGSTSGCTIIVAGSSGNLIRVIGITFTTSASQRIGWLSGSTTTASTLLQSPMSFANFGGMDINRGPWGYIWQGGSGSALVLTTTTACYVAGNLAYVLVPG